MKKNKDDGFIVLQDSKEKVGYWDLTFGAMVLGKEVTGLKTGDYSIKGMEDLVCIERKRNTGEISLNLGQKWKTFKAELERMQSFKYRYVICEFHSSDVLFFPAKSGIPEKLWPYLRMNGKFMLSRINELMETYQTEFIFAGSKNNAEAKAIEILTNVYLTHKSR